MKYEDKYILENFNLVVDDGQILVLLGESGCGKTTLLKIICGIIEPEKGCIMVDGVDITDFTPQQRKIGYVPQSQVLFPHMTIRKNIEFGLSAQKFPKDTISKLISDIVDLTQTESILDRYPHEISGGQKQRVALARALVVSPRILLLDEPLSSIDASNRESLALMIQRVQRATKTTILYVTHSQEEAHLIADQIGIIHGGYIQQSGNFMSILNSPKNFIIGKILGLENLFSVSSITSSDTSTQISTDLGIIKTTTLLPSHITGIQFPAHLIQIKSAELDENNSETPSPLIFKSKGKIISRHFRPNNVVHLMVEILKPKLVYLKIFCPSGENSELYSVGQKIILSILIADIILL